MKIIINSKEFKKATDVAGRLVPAVSTIPTLTFFKLQAKASYLFITGYNMITSATAKCECTVEEEGTVLLDAGLVQAILSKNEGEVVLDVDKKSASLSVGTSKYNLVAMDEKDYPELPVSRKSESVTIPGDVFKDAYKRLAAYINDKEAKATSGLYLKIGKDNITFVACDGFSLAKICAEVDGGALKESEVVIPKEAAKTIASICGDAEVEISVGARHLFIKSDNVLVTSRLLDGKYLDYDAVLTPASNGNVTTLDGDVLMEAIESATPLIDDARKVPVVLDFGADSIKLSSMGPLGKMNTECKVTESASDVKIGMNVSFLKNALNAAGSGQITIKTGSDVDPLMVENEGVQVLVLPIKLRKAG